MCIKPKLNTWIQNHHAVPIGSLSEEAQLYKNKDPVVRKCHQNNSKLEYIEIISPAERALQSRRVEPATYMLCVGHSIIELRSFV